VRDLLTDQLISDRLYIYVKFFKIIEVIMEKKYDHLASEKHVQAIWEQQGTYVLRSVDGPLYSIDTPPPTVSGSLHIGHIFSYTQTDIMARYKRMSGHAVFYPFGFDDNGLPTERYVEKKRGISALKTPRSEFIDACLEETVHAREQFKELWQRIGISADWQQSYSTISEQTRAIAQSSFIDLYKKGFVYRKEEPALYDVAYQTSVAQADLEDVEKEATMYTIQFATTDGELIRIATTRPELLASCVAVFYHPDDERYQYLRDKNASVPLFGDEVPIIADGDVDPEKGTGLVMCCTFGDKTDIAWFKTHDLPYKQSIGFDGRFVERTGFLSGLKVPAARDAIIAKLDEAGHVLDTKSITHAVSVYERSKKEIEYVVIKQWFIRILPHKEKLLELAEEINWYPAFMKSRFIDWVKNLQWDWCISRQRTYGIPFPVWYTPDGEVVLPDEDNVPIDPQEDAYAGTDYDSASLTPDNDVMDTWNTSSLSPYICCSLYENNSKDVFDGGCDEFIPMSMRPQAHDIIRTWAFYTLVKTWMHQGRIPWKDIVISGHVVSGEREKMSKSKGTQLDPEKLLEQYPADAIRFWAGSATLGYDTAFSENMLKIGKKLLVKLWNACRFAQQHVADITPQERFDELDPVNAWILHRATQTYNRYHEYFEKYESGLALQAVEHFFWHDVCDNYLELIKDQLFNPERYAEHDVTRTKAVLQHVLLRTLQLYAPYVSHVTETIYQAMFVRDGVAESIHTTKYADVQIPYNEEESVAVLEHVLKIVSKVRWLKSEHSLALNTEIICLKIMVPQEWHDALHALDTTIMGVTRAQEIIYVTDTAGSSHLELELDAWYATVVLTR
jgi:valyl-tRNA synthetase